MYDAIIKNARVFDGTTNKGQVNDVAIKDGLIANIAPSIKESGQEVVDGKGLFLSPGFIDLHCHTDLLSFAEPEMKRSRIDQGVTTDLSGQCGVGPAPYTDRVRGWKDYAVAVIGNAPKASWHWPRFADFLEEVSRQKLLHNQALLISHGAMRADVVGLNDVPMTKPLIDKMCQVLKEALDAGAFGASFGLSYLPGMYTEKEELMALARTLADEDAVFMVHIRSHAAGLKEAIEEMLEITRQTGVKMHISHLKSYANRRYGADAETILTWLSPAFDEGLDVTYDEHPYSAGSTTLSQLLPPNVRAGGAEQMLRKLQDESLLEKLEKDLADPNFSVDGWDNFVAIAGWENVLVSTVGNVSYKHWEHWTIKEMAEKRDVSPFRALIDLIVADNGESAMIMLNIFDDEDLARLMVPKVAMVGSDGIPTGKPHPRLYGSFPLFLHKIVKVHQALGWEEAISRITGQSAQRIGLKDRGFIRQGYAADLVLFDPERLYVEEKYTGSLKKPEGIIKVWVNGKPALEGHGKLLRR